MTPTTKKTLVWVGALVLGVAAVGGVAYAATHQMTSGTSPTPNPPAPNVPPAPAPAPLPQPTLVTNWAPGSKYLFTSQVPAGITNADQLIALLAQNGWSNATILYFGPTGSQVAGATIPFSTTTTTYVAAGTWGGSAATPVPGNVQSVMAA